MSTIRTHCKHGHHFSPENIQIRAKHGRVYVQCRQCHREAMERFRSEHSRGAARQRIWRAVQSCAVKKLLANLVAMQIAEGRMLIALAITLIFTALFHENS